jgi:hypothetical protein
VNVTFKTGVNEFGILQQECVLCGDCNTGCNYMSKNTLLMNYLPDSVHHGAVVFTNVEVRHVEQITNGNWKVVVFDSNLSFFSSSDRNVSLDYFLFHSHVLFCVSC